MVAIGLVIRAVMLIPGFAHANDGLDCSERVMQNLSTAARPEL
jgi:hypothetical protein